MLARRVTQIVRPRCRQFANAATPRLVATLPDKDLQTFRERAFLPATPAILSRGTFETLPATYKWFREASPPALDISYLRAYGSTIVPLELSNGSNFTRIQQSLDFFLDASAAAIPETSIYLAQAPLSDLPQAMQDDLPTPELVRKAGRGDVYDSSIWIGQAPTYTPLHRDPNPNLFVQLVGSKAIRLFEPAAGRDVFAKVQEEIGARASETIRGEEMMRGAEKAALEERVWNESVDRSGLLYHAELNSGDALFIPKGWWHSVKGVGRGMNGSVNWWFR